MTFIFYKLKNINMDEVNYKWVIGQGWVVESENEQLKLMVEETLKEVDRTINFQEYLKENLIEELPDSFWELLDKSITDVEEVVKTESNS